MLYLDVTHLYKRGIQEEILEEASNTVQRTKNMHRSGAFKTAQGSPSGRQRNYVPALYSLAERLEKCLKEHQVQPAVLAVDIRC